MGEWKLKRAKREEMLMSCAGVQTVAGGTDARGDCRRGPADGAVGLLQLVTNTGYEILGLGQLYRERRMPRMPSKS